MITTSVMKGTRIEHAKVTPPGRKISQSPEIENHKAPLSSRNISETQDPKLSKVPVQKDCNVGKDDHKALLEESQPPIVLDIARPNLTKVSEILTEDMSQAQPTYQIAECSPGPTDNTMNTTLEYSGKPLWYLQNESDLLEADLDFESLSKNNNDFYSSEIPEAHLSREFTPGTDPNQAEPNTDQEPTNEVVLLDDSFVEEVLNLVVRLGSDNTPKEL
jgi:hypothetical protein